MHLIKVDKIFNGEQFIQGADTVAINNYKIIDITRICEENVKSYSGILVPGFINSHCHLELSYLHNEFTPQRGMISFLREMLNKRHLFEKELILQKARDWDAQMQKNGIVAVGDIVNSVDTLNIKKTSRIHYLNFVEVFGLNKHFADNIFKKATEIFEDFKRHSLRAEIVPHSPYSLSEDLWKKYFDFEKNTEKISSFHFLESYAEKIFIQKGHSEMSEYFNKELGYDEESYRHLHEKYAVYLEKQLHKNKQVLLVHNTYLSEEDMEDLQGYLEKIYFCLCPNANLFIENKLPNVNLITHYSSNICIGTDSLASNHDLSIMREMNTLLKYFPTLTLQDVLKWATSNGAKALGIEDRYGYIQKGYNTPLNLIQYDDDKRTIEHIKTIY